MSYRYLFLFSSLYIHEIIYRVMYVLLNCATAEDGNFSFSGEVPDEIRNLSKSGNIGYNYTEQNCSLPLPSSVESTKAGFRHLI